MSLLIQGYKRPSTDVYATGGGGLLNRVFRPILPGFIVGSMYANVPLLFFTGYRFVYHGASDPFGIALLLLLLALAFVPLKYCDNAYGHGIIGALLSSLGAQLSAKVVMEDEDAFKPGHPCIIGLEPHSCLPLAMPAVFGFSSPFLPKPLQGRCYALTSTICFAVPLVRQLFWLAGARPANRKTMKSILDAGNTIVINPGGVQEVLHMTHDNELAFLKNRKGFIRMALQTGAPLFPAFAFNQGKALTWYRPGPPIFPAFLVKAMSRVVGFAPIVMWGMWGSTIPHPCSVTVVIGRPIEVPDAQDTPPPELVEEYLQKFISEMEALFERHKVATGCGAMNLRIM